MEFPHLNAITIPMVKGGGHENPSFKSGPYHAGPTIVAAEQLRHHCCNCIILLHATSPLQHTPGSNELLAAKLSAVAASCSYQPCGITRFKFQSQRLSAEEGNPAEVLFA